VIEARISINDARAPQQPAPSRARGLPAYGAAGAT
jgi:hypothetical protein